MIKKNHNMVLLMLLLCCHLFSKKHLLLNPVFKLSKANLQLLES